MSSNISELYYYGNSGLVNPVLLEFLLTFNLVIFAEMIGCGGLVANAINIMNFKKQGLRDRVNVTLTALAVSDFGALLCQLLPNIFFSPFWREVSLPFTSTSILATLFFYPHSYFIRVSGFITAFAAFERCLCVALPLKVKTIISRNTAIAVNFGIYIVLLLYLFPVYYVSYPGWIYIPQLKRSLLTIFYRENAEYVLTITNVVNDLVLPYVTFFILIICTAVIVIELKSKAKWRQSVTGKQTSSGISKTELPGKEKKTVVMLTVVSVIFIVCLTPECILMTVIGLYQDLKLEGPLWDISLLIYSFTSLLETINCSVTIIVYYNMSSRYREIIHGWFPRLMKK